MNYSVWQQLLKLYVRKTVPHALLLVQEQGAGLNQLAQDFAQLLFCQAPADKACGLCRGCTLFLQKTHPDYRELGEQNQACGIDEVRESILFLNQTAHQDGYKVIVLHSADRLLPAAANALLKILEEPLGAGLFILLAQRTQQMLDTLKSRCFVIPVPVLDGAVDEQQQALKKQWCLAFLRKSEQANIQQLATKQPQEALYLFYYGVTELIRCHLQLSTELLYKADELNQLQRAAQRFALKVLYQFLDKASQAIKAAQIPGVNKQLLFESLYYPWKDYGE